MILLWRFWFDCWFDEGLCELRVFTLHKLSGLFVLDLMIGVLGIGWTGFGLPFAGSWVCRTVFALD